MQATAIKHDVAQLMSPNAPLAASASDSGNSSSGASTTITANDFLTLLVAEMKNQDPTSTQDPNAYIDQLVQVNSLQQLIQINQDLGTSAPPGGNGASGNASSVSAAGAAGASARTANTAAAVRAAEQQLKAEAPIDAASRLETALAPKDTSETPSYWGGDNQSSGLKTAGFQPLK